MPRAGTGRRVQLYDLSRKKVIHSLSLDELNRAAAQGSIGWFHNANGKLCVCIQPVPMQSRTSNAIHSKISLVQTDMELNAEGVCDGSREFGLNRFGAVDTQIIGNRIDQSMSKVELWPVVHDDRNVVVCAGRVYGFREMPRGQLGAL